MNNEEVMQKISEMESTISKLKNELSINKQLLQRVAGEEPTSSIAIGELTAITDDEISENPQLVFEHATGTKRGYLSQAIAEVTKEIPTATDSELGLVRYATEEEVAGRDGDGVIMASSTPASASEKLVGAVRYATSEEISERNGNGVIKASSLPRCFGDSKSWFGPLEMNIDEVYTNDASPIQISISLEGKSAEDGTAAVLTVNNVAVAMLFPMIGSGTLTAIIPPNAQYKLFYDEELFGLLNIAALK